MIALGTPNPVRSRIGLIGLGRMGHHFANRLAAEDFDLTLHNRTSATATKLGTALGARIAATPREVAEQSDIIITMLADAAALTSVMTGTDGVLAGLSPTSLVVDMATSGPDAVAHVSALVNNQGATFVDAPVSGSTGAAEAGTLLIMAGATETAFARLQPVFECLGASSVRVGEVGSAAAMKLAVNTMVFAINQSIAETVVLTERAGIDFSIAYDILEASAVGAPVVKYKRAAFENPEDTAVAFSVDLARKDLRLALSLAEQLGVRMPQTHTNLAALDVASGEGLGESDVAAVATSLRSDPTRG